MGGGGAEAEAEAEGKEEAKLRGASTSKPAATTGTDNPPANANDALVRQVPNYYKVSDPNADTECVGSGGGRQFFNGEGGQDIRGVTNRPQYLPDDTSHAGAIVRRRMW